MNHKPNNRDIRIGVIAFCVIAASILLVFAIFKSEVITGILADLLGILAPFFYGFVLAYLLLPIYRFFARKLKDLFFRRPRDERAEKRLRVLANAISVTVTVLGFLALVTGFGFLVLPEVGRSISSIINSAPETGRRVIAWVEKLLADNPQIEATVTQILERYLGTLENWAEKNILPRVTEFINDISSGIIGTMLDTVTFLYNALIGLVAAVYMLLSKDTFAAQSKKLVYAVLPVRAANIFLENMRFIHKTFGGFIAGKLIDSLIIGFLCYLFMVFADMPYAVLISVIIGVTNIIPFFGPFFGAIPSALLILTVSPVQCFYFVIFVFVLQQFDGNILGPRIMSGTVGVPSFWTMFSIIFFSGIFGFLGMIIGVPLCALLISLLSALCQHSLERRKLPVPSEAYANIGSIDPETGEPILLPRKPGLREKHAGLITTVRGIFKRKK